MELAKGIAALTLLLLVQGATTTMSTFLVFQCDDSE